MKRLISVSTRFLLDEAKNPVFNWVKMLLENVDCQIRDKNTGKKNFQATANSPGTVLTSATTKNVLHAQCFLQGNSLDHKLLSE